MTTIKTMLEVQDRLVVLTDDDHLWELECRPAMPPRWIALPPLPSPERWKVQTDARRAVVRAEHEDRIAKAEAYNTPEGREYEECSASALREDAMRIKQTFYATPEYARMEAAHQTLMDAIAAELKALESDLRDG